MEANATPVVTTVAPADVERAVSVLVLPFSADPMARWTYPEALQHITLFPPLVRAFGGRAFAQGTAFQVGDYVGVSLWLPPGTEPDRAAIEASLPTERIASIAAVFEEMARYCPGEPHWYLPLIGVDPAHQREGHGAALLRHALRQCDRDHVPAYLECTNPANIGLSRRHGFEVQGTIRVGSSPPLFPMLRAAR